MGLTLVHARQVACWPWELRGSDGDYAVEPATCRLCDRDVARPTAAAGEVAVCLYCAIDSGLVEAIDIPLGDPWRYADGRA